MLGDCDYALKPDWSYKKSIEDLVREMSGNGKNRNGAPYTPDPEQGSGSDLPIDTPSSGSDGMTVAEKEIANGMSDLHVSKSSGALRRDEYDVDFE